MSDMTPAQAQEALDRLRERRDAWVNLNYVKQALRTVADLTEEWTVEVPFGGEVGTFDVNDPDGLPVTEARARIGLAEIQQTHPGARLYRRYVSPTEAME